MALSDPQSITISGTALSLARIDSKNGRTEYATADGTTKLIILQSSGKRKRSAIRLEVTKIAADPLTAVNSYMSDAIYVMVDRPLVGFTAAELVAQLTGLVSAISASSYGLATRVIGGES